MRASARRSRWSRSPRPGPRRRSRRRRHRRSPAGLPTRGPPPDRPSCTVNVIFCAALNVSKQYRGQPSLHARRRPHTARQFRRRSRRVAPIRRPRKRSPPCPPPQDDRVHPASERREQRLGFEAGEHQNFLTLRDGDVADADLDGRGAEERLHRRFPAHCLVECDSHQAGALAQPLFRVGGERVSTAESVVAAPVRRLPGPGAFRGDEVVHEPPGVAAAAAGARRWRDPGGHPFLTPGRLCLPTTARWRR